MSEDMIRADPGLRRQTMLVLGIAVLMAIATVYFFQQWLSGIADIPGTDQLILRLRRLIGIALTGSAICLGFLAWYAARKATLIKTFEQWPLPGVRVLRDTPVRRGAAAMKIRQGLNLTAVVLLLLALGMGIISWRLLSLS
ncbi:MAG TPA: hypothetical protein VFN25_01335 [Dokdonella sp.]|uniref:hypothetical protein n=1 Tax=Dokdonella sp. TaxID=2291710 RepID=UPI002D7E2CA7|nr:hypothetical protein [Dokdonella sp.]HET9031525.1 hypothetical protein [Dokdonella sp.]